jgi:hypothetical protein
MFDVKDVKMTDAKNNQKVLIPTVATNLSNITRFLQGPITLTHHISQVFNKNIYVFGEVHDTEKVCIDTRQSVSMEVFLDQTIKANTNKIIDIFIEQPYHNKFYGSSNEEHKLKEIEKQYKYDMEEYEEELAEYKRNLARIEANYKFNLEQYKYDIEEYEEEMAILGPQSLTEKPVFPVKETIEPPVPPTKGKIDEASEYNSLFKLVTHFKTCIPRWNKGTTNKCPYPNVRIHLTDVRQQLNIENYIGWLDEFGDIINDRTKKVKLFRDLNADEREELIYDIVGTASMMIKSDGIFSTLEDFKEQARINKNLKAIQDTKLSEEIAKWFDTRLNKYGINLDFIKNAIRLYQQWLTEYKPLLKRDNNYESRLSHLDAKIDKICKDIRDFGVLMVDYYTITRIFRGYKPKTQTETWYSQPAKDIVIYVGDAHARNYREFLNYMKFKQVEATQSTQYIMYSYPFYSCLDITKIKQHLFQ